MAKPNKKDRNKKKPVKQEAAKEKPVEAQKLKPSQVPGQAIKKPEEPKYPPIYINDTPERCGKCFYFLLSDGSDTLGSCLRYPTATIKHALNGVCGEFIRAIELAPPGFSDIPGRV